MLVAAILKEKDTEYYYLVGATGTNYGSTNKLQVMNYSKAMATVNCEEWEKAIKLKHEKMVKYNVFQVVNKDYVPKGTKLMNFTWDMKNKSNGIYRARLAIKVFQQKEGLQYQADDKSAPVINGMTIKIVLTLIVLITGLPKLLMFRELSYMANFNEAPKKLYASVPQGLEKWYLHNTILLMFKTIYSMIQGAIQWWHKCYKAMYYLKWKQHDVDPCLFLKWDNDTGKLILFLLYVDYCLITSGTEAAVNHEADKFAKLFKVTDKTPDGIIKEYVG